MSSQKTSTKPGSTIKKTVAKKAAPKASKAGAMVTLVPAVSSTSAYNYYANNSKARSAAVARFYGSGTSAKRKLAK